MKRVTAFLLVCLLVSQAAATLYTFECLTNNSAGNAATGQAQLSVDVTSAADGAQFTFTNTGSTASIVARIYFYGDLLDSLVSMSDSGDGVAFTAETDNPGHLPGYPPHALIPVKAELYFSSKGGGVHNGLDAGNPPTEWLQVVWSLQPDKMFDDLIDGLDDGTVLIGMHVQAFGNNGSESFSQIPEPATLVLLGLGMLGSLVLRRR